MNPSSVKGLDKTYEGAKLVLMFVIALLVELLSVGAMVQWLTAPSSKEIAQGCQRHQGVAQVAASLMGPRVIVCRDGKVWQR